MGYIVKTDVHVNLFNAYCRYYPISLLFRAFAMYMYNRINTDQIISEKKVYGLISFLFL